MALGTADPNAKPAARRAPEVPARKIPDNSLDSNRIQEED